MPLTVDKCESCERLRSERQELLKSMSSRDLRLQQLKQALRDIVKIEIFEDRVNYLAKVLTDDQQRAIQTSVNISRVS